MTDYPYPGIRPFTRPETDIFFGREQQADALIERLGSTRLLAVVGSSGCGKSSLVKTGLIAGLETGFLARAGACWKVAEMRPGTAPFHNLAESLAALYQESAKTTHSSPSTPEIEVALKGGALGLHHLLAAHPLPDGINLLIVADQFEELFRYADDADAVAEAASFVSLLLAGARPYPLPDGRVSDRIYGVITMRSDFIGDCARFPGLAEAVNAGLYLTPRLTREQLREAVSEPPLVTGCDIEPALVNRLLEDVADDPDQLPLLQHVLQWMWLRARVQPRKNADDPVTLTLKNYESLGGFGKALSDRLDDIYENLSPEEQRIAEILFRNLSKRDLEQRDIRRPVRLRHVADLAGVGPDAVKQVVEVFRADSRNFIMVSLNRDDPDNPLLDVCHESLLRQWERLREWLEDEAESASMYRRLEDAALRREQGSGDLWQKLELANALDWLVRKDPKPAWAKRYGRDSGAHFDRVIRFLDASREAEIKTRRKRQVFTSFFIVFLIAIAMVLWMQLEFTQKSEETAKKAQSETALVEKERTKELFESYLTHASLQAKIEDYATAKKILEKSRGIEAENPPSRRHARDLLDWYVTLMSGTSKKVYEGAGVPLFDVAVSPDKKVIAAVGEKGTVVLFDTKSGAIVRKLKGHQENGHVWSVVFHPEGKWMATAGDDRLIIFWSMTNGNIIRKIALENKVGPLSLSPDAKTLAFEGLNGSIILWNIETNEKILTLEGHSQIINSLSFSPNGRLLASGSYDHTAGIWDVETGKMLYQLWGHMGNVEGVAFHPNGQILATCSRDQTIILWNMKDGHPIAILRGHKSGVLDIAFTKYGDRLVSVSSDRTIRIWDMDTNVNLRIFQGHPLPISGLFINENTLFSASNDCTVREWNLGPDMRMRIKGVPDKAISSAISSDGQKMAVGLYDGGLYLYSLNNFEEIWKNLNAHDNQILRLSFSPDDKTIASTSHDKTLKLWNADKGYHIKTFNEHTSSISGIDFSPNGRFIATAGYDGKIGLFEIDKEEGKLFKGHNGHARSVMFDHTGKKLLSAGGDGEVKLWNVRSQSIDIIRNFPQFTDMSMWATISPDGSRVAAVGRDALVHIFNTTDGTEIHRFAGHEDTIYRVAFNPNGEQLITLSGDATVSAWDLKTLEQLFSIKLPMNIMDKGPWDFSFRCTPTGCWIVVPLTRGKVVVYRMDNFYEEKE